MACMDLKLVLVNNFRIYGEQIFLFFFFVKKNVFNKTVHTFLEFVKRLEIIILK